jgi:hypothetical protein
LDAIAMSPCVFVLNREVNARSADALAGSTRQTANATAPNVRPTFTRRDEVSRLGERSGLTPTG